MKKLFVSVGLILFSLSTAQTCGDGFRLFDHELLVTEPVCILENPERVLALDMASVEMTLLTGKNLVGTANWILGELPILEPSRICDVRICPGVSCYHHRPLRRRNPGNAA